MKKIISTQDFWSVSRDQAWKICRNIQHRYGECSTVCDLVENNRVSSSRSPCEIGIIDMNDLGLIGGKDTFKNVIEKSLEMGYLKITPTDVFNYIDKLNDHRFGNQTTIMSIMDEVVDGDGCRGRIYLQPDEDGFLYGLGFFQIDESKTLSQTAKFLVKKPSVTTIKESLESVGFKVVAQGVKL